MIALDASLPGEVLYLRPSMIKFEGSDARDIEICGGAYTPLPMRLNRQLIKIMEDLGVRNSFFLRLQRREVARLRGVMNSVHDASTFLRKQDIGNVVHLSWMLGELARYNLDFRQDPFLVNVLELGMLIELRKLKHKASIPVPKGLHLHGIMDETGYLKEGQIFVVFLEEGVPKVLVKNDVVISRAPALHPGDVQVVNAVNVPINSNLRNLHNCVCFSQHGSRDLPSMLSGGDLDGDLYYVMWEDDGKINRRRLCEPADYPRVEPIDIGRQFNVHDMTDFFIKYMEYDQLGRIAVQHQILADQRPDGTFDPDCIRLAELHSTAVDFAKTGLEVSPRPRSAT